jgi:hypothetical protein
MLVELFEILNEIVYALGVKELSALNSSLGEQTWLAYLSDHLGWFGGVYGPDVL